MHNKGHQLKTGDAKRMLKIFSTLSFGSPLTLHGPGVSGMCTFILFAHLLPPKLETALSLLKVDIFLK